jgi:hypothetical protein
LPERRMKAVETLKKLIVGSDGPCKDRVWVKNPDEFRRKRLYGPYSLPSCLFPGFKSMRRPASAHDPKPRGIEVAYIVSIYEGIYFRLTLCLVIAKYGRLHLDDPWNVSVTTIHHNTPCTCSRFRYQALRQSFTIGLILIAG